MKLTRRSLLLGAAAGALATPFLRTGPARAAEINLKLANNQPLTHPMNVRGLEAVERIKEQTGGRVEITIFPQSQLGADTDVLSQLRSGGVDFFFLSPLILSTFVPNASLSGIGFAFHDYPTVWKAMDGELGAYVRGQIEEKGLFAFEKIWDNGFRQISSSTKPIVTPADLENFKIRVPVSPLWTSMFTAFGSAPTSINFAEVYTALQTGTVDGQENPLAILSNFKLWEVQKYVSMTNHMWDGFWLLAGRRSWSGIPDDVKEIIQTAFNESGMQQRADIEALNASLQGELEKNGMVFNTPELPPFKQKLIDAGFYGEWKGKFGDDAWAILEAATAQKLG
ncbi:TRAP transporter substrate-binding protein [Amaricoccus sp.]|uniref:TRAP transporter substrate-binding protein n=1 Tax=Amaricoccus sp. TaxID=1872485 RepID=UPI001B41E01D|nr:TRAP transporter substrate-binding protein [Amaricoccus sp.]MBP7002645.1 TRAP transporter substrate-binding protein [Amaricoccus sp.]